MVDLDTNINTQIVFGETLADKLFEVAAYTFYILQEIFDKISYNV